MALLMMRGKPVLNAMEYARLFDLYDALEGKDRLVSFAATHLRMDYLAAHHVQMLRRAVAGDSFEDSREFYWNAYEPKADLPKADACPNRAEQALALDLYDQTESIAFEPERMRLCAAAIAAALLAGRETLEPLDARKALAAWRGVTNAENNARGDEVGARIENGLTLLARKAAYALPSLETAPEKPRLSTCRIDVLPISPGDGSQAARLEARGESLDVPRGGSAYVNVHEGLAAHLLPNRGVNGEAEMTRAGNELTYARSGNARSIPAEEVTSFAPEAFKDCYLLVRDSRLDISHAYRRNSDSNLQWVATRSGVVEVQTRGQYYLVLLANGRVISDNPDWDDRRGVTRLDDVKG